MANLVDEARNGRLEGVRSALNAGQDANQKNAQGDTALLWAVSNKRLDIMELLLERGATPDLANASNNVTPLQLALNNNFSEGIRLLNEVMSLPRAAEEQWKKMGASTVAHVGIYPAIGEKLTSVFNFSSRERYVISEGLKEHHKAVGPSTGFDALPQATIVEALEQFTKLGGVADRDFVLGGRSELDKPKIKMPVA